KTRLQIFSQKTFGCLKCDGSFDVHSGYIGESTDQSCLNRDSSSNAEHFYFSKFLLKSSGARVLKYLRCSLCLWFDLFFEMNFITFQHSLILFHNFHPFPKAPKMQLLTQLCR